ncbi:MAG: TRAP transporter large permease subunit, partial [Firmicutes bacterium]|nr:TRAP transporter large permease subunit [Bacillota bacterium]
KYIILATLVAPALVALGAPLLASHLFILYFGTDADITPPVGLAAYAAAGIAGAHPLQTGIEAFKMGVTAYIVPFCFIFGPALLLQGSVYEIILAFATAVLACAGLGAAMQGYFVRKMPYWHRGLLFIGSVMLMEASWQWDLAGLAIVGGIFALEYFSERVIGGGAAA